MRLSASLLLAMPMGLLIACNNAKTLTPEDYAWMPYRGNETLVFQSNTGRSDTISLVGRDTALGYAEPIALNGIVYEVVTVDYLDVTQQKRAFVELSKSDDERTELIIHLRIPGVAYCDPHPAKIDELEKNRLTLVTRFGQRIEGYKIIVEREPLLDELPDCVTTFYWSKADGLVRFDRKDGISWELIKKY